MPYANSEGPDERAYPLSLSCTFSFRRHMLHWILHADNEGPDQPAWTIACVVRRVHKGHFHALHDFSSFSNKGTVFTLTFSPYHTYLTFEKVEFTTFVLVSASKGLF